MNKKTNNDPHMGLIEAAHRLDYIAKACYTVGNTVLGDELFTISEDITNAIDAISQQEAEAVNKQLTQAEQGTRNMIDAVFAGMKLNEMENEQKT